MYRAAKIVHQMAQAHASEKGAIGLDLGDGKDGKEMIDAPMLKQVCIVSHYAPNDSAHDSDDRLRTR